MERNGKKRIAIACQGGGSHTAFTAGALKRLTDAKPDGIWVIQIDPEKREEEPRSMVDILDRRNELTGNLSLYQEIHFVEKINDLVAKLGQRREPRGQETPHPR